MTAFPPGSAFAGTSGGGISSKNPVTCGIVAGKASIARSMVGFLARTLNWMVVTTALTQKVEQSVQLFGGRIPCLDFSPRGLLDAQPGPELALHLTLAALLALAASLTAIRLHLH